MFVAMEASPAISKESNCLGASLIIFEVVFVIPPIAKLALSVTLCSTSVAFLLVTTPAVETAAYVVAERLQVGVTVVSPP